MPLVYVGGRTGTWAGATSGNNNISLTLLSGGISSTAAIGDIVVAVYATGSAADRTLAIQTPGGVAYTLIDSERYANGTTYDSNLRVAYRILTAADANTVFGPTGNAADAGAAAVHVWRGINTATPLDVTAVGTQGTGTGRPNPPAITPTTTGAVVIATGGAAAGTGALFVGTGLSNFITATSIDTNDGMVGVGSFAWTSGTYDPAAWTGGTTNAADSWTSITLALRPSFDQTLNPGLYTNTQTFYSPSITQTGGDQTLSPSLYTNSQTFFDTTVAASNTLTPSLYTNDQTFYSATVTQTSPEQNLSPDRYDNTNTFYAQTVSATNSLTPARYDNTNAFYAAAVETAYTLTPARYDNGQTFFAATVESQYSLSPDRYDNTQTFYSPAVSAAYSLTPDRYDNAQTFYGLVIDASNTLEPSRYDNAQTFYAAVVSQSGAPQTLLPELYENTQAFYSATVQPGEVTLAPDRYDNVQTFYSPTVDQNTVLQPQRLDNAQQFYEPTLSSSNSLDVPRVDSVNEFFSATVFQGTVLVPQPYVDDGYFTPEGYASPNTYSVQVFYSPTVVSTYELTPNRYDNTQNFYGPTVALQDVLAPSLYVNSNTFYSPTVTPGPVDLQPSLYVNTNQFFSAAVELGTYTITTAQARLLQQIYKLNGLDSSPLSVNTKFRTVDNIFQTISEDRSGTVTVETVSGQTFATDDPGQMIEDLAALYALTDILQVTRNGRSVGTLSQSIETSGFTTTVTRLT